jgi:hypothetical protein
MADNPLQAQQDSIRVPVYGTEGFRTDWPTYDQTLINCFAEVIRNPVTGEGDIVATKRCGFANVPTMDFGSLLTDPSTAFPIANYVVSNLYDVYMCAYNDVSAGLVRIFTYRPQSGSVTQVATIASTSSYDKVYFSHGWVDDSSNPTWVVTCTWEDGTGAATKGFAVEASGGTISVGTWAQITHANSPWGHTPAKQTRGPLLQLNNQWYVASVNGLIHSTGTQNPDKSYVSNADTVAGTAGWADAANFIESRFPESYVGLIQYKHHLVALGLTSMQFFTDEGESINPGTPILPTDQALIKFGCISGKHCINVDDVLYWIAYGKDNTVGMWRLDGYTPVKVSNKKQDDQFRYMAQQPAFLKKGNMFTVVLGNKKHIGCSGIAAYTLGYIANSLDYLPTDSYQIDFVETAANISMYSIEDKTWWYLSSENRGIQTIIPATSFGTSIASPYNMEPYVQYFLQNTSEPVNKSLLNKFVEGTYVDAYNGTTVGICTAINFNNIQVATEKRKRINKVKAILTTNLPKNSSDTTVNSLYLAVSRRNIYDDSNMDEVVLRSIPIPNTFYRYYWNNLGMARTLSLCLIEKTNLAFGVKALEIDLAQGTS